MDNILIYIMDVCLHSIILQTRKMWMISIHWLRVSLMRPAMRQLTRLYFLSTDLVRHISCRIALKHCSENLSGMNRILLSLRLTLMSLRKQSLRFLRTMRLSYLRRTKTFRLKLMVEQENGIHTDIRFLKRTLLMTAYIVFLFIQRMEHRILRRIC